MEAGEMLFRFLYTVLIIFGIPAAIIYVGWAVTELIFEWRNEE